MSTRTVFQLWWNKQTRSSTSSVPPPPPPSGAQLGALLGLGWHPAQAASPAHTHTLLRTWIVGLTLFTLWQLSDTTCSEICVEQIHLQQGSMRHTTGTLSVHAVVLPGPPKPNPAGTLSISPSSCPSSCSYLTFHYWYLCPSSHLGCILPEDRLSGLYLYSLLYVLEFFFYTFKLKYL